MHPQKLEECTMDTVFLRPNHGHAVMWASRFTDSDYNNSIQCTLDSVVFPSFFLIMTLEDYKISALIFLPSFYIGLRGLLGHSQWLFKLDLNLGWLLHLHCRWSERQCLNADVLFGISEYLSALTILRGSGNANPNTTMMHAIQSPQKLYCTTVTKHQTLFLLLYL